MSEHEKLIAEGYKPYEDEQIAVYWNPTRCTHAGFCWRGDQAVFDPSRRPWVQLDESKTQSIAAIIDRCPSGALKYILKEA